jgi:hypothetical protein
MTDSPRRYDVGRKIHEVQKLLARTFDYADETHLSPTLDEAMRETEAAFSYEEYDRAEHLAKVTEALIKREAPLLRPIQKPVSKSGANSKKPSPQKLYPGANI